MSDVAAASDVWRKDDAVKRVEAPLGRVQNTKEIQLD